MISLHWQEAWMDWVTSLNSLSVNLIYLVLLVLGLVYAVFLLISGQFAGGGDADLGSGELDLHAEAPADGLLEGPVDQHGISPISPLTIATFITAFGAIGLVSINLFSASDRASLLWAALGGFAFSLLVYFGFTYLFIKPQGSSEVRVAELAGRTAEVITPIPADGLGEVALVSQGGRVTFSARSTHGVSLSRGMTVRVKRVSGGIAFVEPE
jgi:membrane protein implicated in regulation of membrane protease activity